jgi:signal transduction histidine kinase/Na+/proline symporter
MSLTVAMAWALTLMALALGFARWVEHHHEALARYLAHPLTYTLVLGTYFTGWAYFGTGAALFESGISYLSFEIGWSFVFLFAWPLLLKAVRFVQAHGVTTLPGFMAVRFGPSPGLAGLLVAILVLAMLPYLAIQIQAIAFALDTIAAPRPHESGGLGALVMLWAVLVAGFAILFGGRQPDPTRRLPGVFATLAVGGAFKLLVILVVAAVAWWRFGPEVAAMAPSSWPDMRLNTSAETSYLVWVTNMVIAATGIMLLPHMFYLGVVEARDARQVTTSRWAFPLYGWLFEAALVPITIAGVLLGLAGSRLQGAVLVVPEHEGLRLAAFLGGVAAASGMAVISLIALANMLLLDAVLPLLGRRIHRAAGWLVPLRAGIIAMLALAATVLWHVAERAFLFEMGLVAFVALAQVAPAFVGGLLWPQLRGRAIGWGLALASLVWLYTAALPSLTGGLPALAGWVAEGPWGWGFLRPQALLGVEGLPPAAHAFLWCSLVNLGAIWVVMAKHPPSAVEVVRARTLLAGESAPHTGRPLVTAVDWVRLDRLVTSFLGPIRAREEIARVQAAFTESAASPDSRMLAARDALERVLRGPLGPTVARSVVDQEFPVTEPSIVEVIQAYRQLEHLLTLSQDELAERIQELTRLKESLEARVEARTTDLAAERDRLKTAYEDLRNLENLKTTFVNAVSHDLRIPLTGIMGYAEFLEEELEGPLTEAQQAYVAHILDASRRMASLLNELLDYARMEAGQFTVEPRAVDFAGLLEQAAATFYPVFERKRLRYTAELPEGLPEVHADPERVVQVLSNLLSNAAKFTPEGGAIAARARLMPERAMLYVEVTDTGVGIPPEDLPHLFERFFQTHAGKTAGGTGLGLSICKTLIEAQGGEMGATSQPGQGTTLWFTLPLEQEEGP